MTGTIAVSCPAMLTTKVSSTRRLTSEIPADVTITLASYNNIQGLVLKGGITFPVVAINKVFGPLWQVDEVTASGSVTDPFTKLVYKLSITLQPEWTFGPLALPCKAKGTLFLPEGGATIIQRYPFVWASYTGSGKWTVAPVTAFGTVSL
jgi:hypothetical protein